MWTPHYLILFKANERLVYSPIYLDIKDDEKKPVREHCNQLSSVERRLLTHHIYILQILSKLTKLN